MLQDLDYLEAGKGQVIHLRLEEMPSLRMVNVSYDGRCDMTL